ncbi:DNA ligase 3-like isoform X2 [Stegodyphus dumicola]|uniref:DNA ligase 3-like isoform X2 n=1 Tax=Stegodyphus dumicola TaxID=202533 RepID=UPI0015ACF67D|nr:DNA ligase 3-like isoform X2 [Stegodyphus dumicola]
MNVLSRIFRNIYGNLKCYNTILNDLATCKNCISVVSCVENFIMANNRYCVDLAKRGVAGCKNCNVKIDKGLVRIAKIIPNPFTESGGDMKQWFHVRCIFEKLSRARATTKKIEGPDDLEGWDQLSDEHREEVLKCLSEFSSNSTPKKNLKKTPTKSVEKSFDSPTIPDKPQSPSKDDTLREFRKVCSKIAEEPSYKNKTAILSDFFSKGSDGESFKGDLFLWVKLLLPNVGKRVYNLQSKQLVKLFSEIFSVSYEEMLEDLEQGDVAETIKVFFESSKSFLPESKSTLTLQEVDSYLDQLTRVSKEMEQSQILTKVAKRCTGNDLKMFIRFIKHDLRINAGPKPILDAINPSAYAAFQALSNLEDVIRRAIENNSGGSSQKQLTIESSLMTPVLPMLAMICKSVDEAFKRCPNGLYVEIKYDGERIQVHKKGTEFSYFSRSLKPVMQHKDPKVLKSLITSVKKQGLEGIVVKDKCGVYEPGKRHWLKIKKDYSEEAGMIDSADLVVLGAYYGTGQNGGLMSIFLMGCLNKLTGKWCTVTKARGFDDETLERLQTELDMIKISKDPSKVPSWLNVSSSLIPDFVSANPKKSPVWEITGDEFSKAEVHTANGISIRFPRVTRIRNDKTWETATSLQELEEIYAASKETTDLIGLVTMKKNKSDDDDDDNDGTKNGTTYICDKSSSSSSQTPSPKNGKNKRNCEVRSPSSKESISFVKKAKLNVYTKEPACKTVSEKEVLPNIFTGVKLFIPQDLDKSDILRRYFIAYDGILLKENEKNEANYVILTPSLTESKALKNAKKVTEDWIWDCIKLQKRLPADLYKPKAS